MNNKRLNLNTIIITLLIAVSSLLYYFYPSKTTKQINSLAHQVTTKYVSTSPTTVKNEAKTSEEITMVTKVIDGDTIVIDTGQHVRYIGINSPEIHNPRTGSQCGGKEAMAKNKELVLSKRVRLEKDVSETDRYGRLLRYVYVVNDDDTESFVNAELVKLGFANVDTYPPDVSHAQEFIALAAKAREAVVGLWSSCQAK